ncbi:hypothetical protein GCM10027429_17180 [Marivirga atlantica]|jgi:hypothetical protein|uniref:Uncharacterized protein n=1 Tax=Marivirga atlantica TaxID=1548457 RepID=A0A937DJW5_9BACT|nr:hypothetical protein [Marivirga atlantica]MBL0765334.1 hypothetical protein [Marivirga atlantica]
MKKLLSLLILFLFTLTQELMAQCAMCRATVENNVSNGEAGIANGLNIGILYLFATPYLVIAIIGYLWYRQSKKQKVKINIKDRIVS